MKRILNSIGNFLMNIIRVESDISSKRACLFPFMAVVTVMWVIMSFKRGELAAIDSGVVAIIAALAAAAAADHFASPRNGKGGKK